VTRTPEAPERSLGQDLRGFTFRSSGISSSEIRRMLGNAVDAGMPAQFVRTTR
jgi:hypothetical protein